IEAELPVEGSTRKLITVRKGVKDPVYKKGHGPHL
ncbi:hypothetical protein LCGC14_2170040, partial [marine sediment metagenome]